MELNREQRQKAHSLFAEALACASHERFEYLREACKDSQIVKEVESLLANHAELGIFLRSVSESGSSSSDIDAAQPFFDSGETLAGRFRICRFLARGGMGEVYEAWDTELDTAVALKTIRPDLVQEALLTQFKTEVQLAKQVTHPNVCRVYDLFRDSRGGNSVVLISMELLQGETLAERLRKRPVMTEEEAWPIIQQVGCALQAAHAAGVLHRDLKPENVVLVSSSEGERAVVTDFGLAMPLRAVDAPTRFAQLAGTPAYMSPEQLQGLALTAASDIYSFGLVIYRMVAGIRAYDDGEPSLIGLRRLLASPQPPRELNPKLSRRWDRAILNCLERDPSRRPATVRNAVELLDTKKWQPIATIVGAGLISMALLLTFTLQEGHKVPAPAVHMGRFLVRATSQGRGPTRIPLPHEAEALILSPDGRKLFAASLQERRISSIDLTNRSIRTFDLPPGGTTFVASPKGLLYIGSTVDGVWTLDVSREQLGVSPIPTGGRVWDMALSPDGEKLFLAMGYKGLKRVLTRSGRIDPISDRICPTNLAIDPVAKNLLVAYECSGTGGRAGHNAVDILNIASENSISTIVGPPMVGQRPWVSPDGKLVLLDSGDACFEPYYDRQGCPGDRAFHLIRTSDRRLLWTGELPATRGLAGFLDSTRFLMTDKSLAVYDMAKYATLEKLDLGTPTGPVTFNPSSGHLYLAMPDNGILDFEADPDECSPHPTGLVVFYPADGAGDDTASLGTLIAHGSVRFVPGRVGQAFFLDGKSFLEQSAPGHYDFVRQDSTMVLYVKFAAENKEAIIMDWAGSHPAVGIRVFKSTSNHFVVQTWPGENLITSTTVARPDEWYHLAITRTDQDLTLYVNGEADAHGASSPASKLWDARSLFFGSRGPGSPSLIGWLDEIGFYNRALAADEMRQMFRTRETGPCRI